MFLKDYVQIFEQSIPNDQDLISAFSLFHLIPAPRIAAGILYKKLYYEMPVAIPFGNDFTDMRVKNTAGMRVKSMNPLGNLLVIIKIFRNH
jgi:hypothetical protein